MNTASLISAAGSSAFEGFRLARREPKSILVWMSLWLGWFSVTAFAVASGQAVDVSRRQSYASLKDITEHFGPYALLLVVLFLLVWAATTVATFRAVLEPAERRFFYLRLGIDEFRVAIMTVLTFVLVVLLGGAPAFLLFVLISPLMAAIPALARDIATAGAVATVCLDLWLAVRLSLIAVETFAEKRFHLAAYWPVTSGRFWYLFLSYFVWFGIVFLLGLVFAGALILVELLIATLGAPEGADLLRRGGLLGLAGILAAVTSGFFFFSWFLFFACQAHAFRAISVGEAAGELNG